jgi:hypothetical protein
VESSPDAGWVNTWRQGRSYPVFVGFSWKLPRVAAALCGAANLSISGSLEAERSHHWAERRRRFGKTSLLAPLLVQAQKAQVTPFPSRQISVASYDDKLHWWTFPTAIRDPALKPFAVVITNGADQPVIAAHVNWTWIGADGKPRQLVQEHNSLLSTYGYVVNAKFMVLILPNGMAIQKGSRPLPSGFFRSQRTMSATQIHVALDAVILADGQVIGPDNMHLVAELQGQAEAAAMMKAIINAAKAQGRDPQPEIDKAIEDAPPGSATRRYMVEMMHSRPRGGKMQVPPQIQLPYFYRK